MSSVFPRTVKCGWAHPKARVTRPHIQQGCFYQVSHRLLGRNWRQNWDLSWAGPLYHIGHNWPLARALLEQNNQVWLRISMQCTIYDRYGDSIIINIPNIWKRHSKGRNVCLVAQSCPTLCDPMYCSPPGTSIHWDSLGKNTGVSCHAFLQGIFPTQGSKAGLPHCRQILYHLSHQ